MLSLLPRQWTRKNYTLLAQSSASDDLELRFLETRYWNQRIIFFVVLVSCLVSFLAGFVSSQQRKNGFDLGEPLLFGLVYKC